MKKKLLSLVMIVKDEASNIRGVLEAAKPFIDYATIVDTGSTDDTKKIIQEVLTDNVTLVEEPFVDFSTTRNLALEIDANFEEKSEFQLVLSGDEYLRNGQKLRQYLEGQRGSDIDCHRIRISIDDSTFLSPRVFRTGSAWRYEGVVHEVPYNRSNPNSPIGNVPDVTIDHIVSDPERRYATIWENHIPILRQQLEENPEDARALVFLAQSYENLVGMMPAWERIKYMTEAMSLYLRRFQLPFETEAEKNWCRMRYLSDARFTGIYSDQEMYLRCQELYKDDPSRPETAMLLVHAGSKVAPLQVAYDLAANAARVAFEARNIENCSPVSSAIEWQANFLAAKAAKRLSEKYPEQLIGDAQTETWESLKKKHIEAGLAAGGAWTLFKTIDASQIAMQDEKTTGTQEALQ